MDSCPLRSPSAEPPGRAGPPAHVPPRHRSRTATLLDAAADRAPDAAPAGVDRPTHGLGPGELEGITATAAQVGRGGVLAAARAAIDRHRAARDR